MRLASIGGFALVALAIACGPAPDAAHPAAAPGAGLVVMSSATFSDAYRALLPAFQRATGIEVATAYGPSIGHAPDAIPSRMQRGEPVDVVILAGSGLDALTARGWILPGSRVDLARSRIAMAVRAGHPRLDITTVDRFRQVLLAARSIAYSDSVSGAYISTTLFARLGIEDQVRGKLLQVQSERVGKVVARGEAEIGFQQISELLPVAGIDVVGPIPAELQHVTVFSAAVTASAQHPEAARALIRFLSSPDALPAITRSGLDPVARWRE